MGQRRCRSRQEKRREGGGKGGREGVGEGGEDVVLVQIVVKAVRSQEEHVPRLGAEGKELPEFRPIAERGGERGRGGGREGRVKTTIKSSL